MSVIIPTLNEERYIANTISSILKNAGTKPWQIIVVDNGSRDCTKKRAQEYDVEFYHKPELKGKKYASLNFGGEVATGDTLLFLDADSIVPAKFDELIEEALNSTGVVAGAFEFEFSRKNKRLLFIEKLNRARYHVTKRFFGDQGLFLRKDLFLQTGGYPGKLMLESAHYCRTLGRLGKLKIVSQSVLTSPRRFLKGGIIPVFANDCRIWFLDILGFSTENLGRAYWLHNERSVEI